MARKKAAPSQNEGVRRSDRLLPGVRTSERASKPKGVARQTRKRRLGKKITMSDKIPEYIAEVTRNKYSRPGRSMGRKPINTKGFMKMIGVKSINKKFQTRLKGAMRKRNARIRRNTAKEKQIQKDYGDDMWNMFSTADDKAEWENYTNSTRDMRKELAKAKRIAALEKARAALKAKRSTMSLDERRAQRAANIEMREAKRDEINKRKYMRERAKAEKKMKAEERKIERQAKKAGGLIVI